MTPEEAQKILDASELYVYFHSNGSVVVDGRASLQELEAVIVVARSKLRVKS